MVLSDYAIRCSAGLQTGCTGGVHAASSDVRVK